MLSKFGITSKWKNGWLSWFLLITDVLLISDVFEKFINRWLESSSISLFWFSSIKLVHNVKITQIKLKLISDIAKYFFVKKRLRWGLYYIPKRSREANKKYIKNYDPTKESKYIIDFDAINLYGRAMSQYVLCDEFKWVKHFDVNSISENRLDGYILEADLGFPDELHNLHNDYSLTPKKRETTYDILSDYCKKLLTNTT